MSGKIAILRWESGKVPKGLMQMEAMIGNSTNRGSYPFPVELVEVKGANTETVIIHPSQELLEDMIALSQRLVRESGIKAITTSCGFNAIFQKQLAEAVDVPVFTSALLQVPFVQATIGASRSVCIVTANKGCLTDDHLKACGIDPGLNYYVIGLEESTEWNKIFDQPEETFDVEAVSADIISHVDQAVAAHPGTGAVVLECTDLPPYRRAIMAATGLPVFDFNTMMAHLATVVGDLKLYD